MKCFTKSAFKVRKCQYATAKSKKYHKGRVNI